MGGDREEDAEPGANDRARKAGMIRNHGEKSEG